MKKTIACLLILSLALCSAYALAEDAHRYEGTGFATPEEAVQAYLAGVQQGDLARMLSAFAIETYVDHYDFEAQLERIQIYTITMDIRFPNDSELMRSLNVETRKGQIANAISYQQLCLVSAERDFTTPITFREGDDMTIPGLMEMFAAAAQVDLSGLTFVGFFAPEMFSDVYLNERNQENMGKQAAVYGMEELKSMVAGFTLGGEQYLQCCDVCRYGDAWYIYSLGGNISQLMGVPMMQAGLVPFSAAF